MRLRRPEVAEDLVQETRCSRPSERTQIFEESRLREVGFVKF
jgi:hypothetical protein